MSLSRVKTVLIHTWHHLTHSMESWIDIFWFSFIDIIVFGLISTFFIRETGNQQISFIILGIILWEVVRVGQYSIAVGAMWEIWSKSFSSLFVTPLTMTEFLLGQVISSFFKALFVFILTAVIGFFLYDFSILSLGFMIPLYLLELLIFAWAAGFFTFALVLRYGTDIQALSWSLIFLFQPIGAFLYPVEVLPLFMQIISYAFPLVYVTEAIRYQLTTGFVRWDYLLFATVLNTIYLTFCYWFIKRMFARSLESGSFVRMEA